MAWHIFLSLIGVILCFYIDYTTQTFLLGITNLGCVLLLFGYSVTLKKKLLIGNILISVLTSWVIIVMYLCYRNSFYNHGIAGPADPNISIRFIRITMLYAGFAFVISLIREVVKDIEDMEGDARYGGKTMPIVWGVPASKMFVAVWIIVLTGGSCVVQFYVLQFGWWWSAVYCLVLIIIPLAWVLRKLYQAKVPKDYHRVSTVIKMIMFTGILSMLLFKIYS